MKFILGSTIMLGILFLLLVPTISAENTDFGTFRQHRCIDVVQTCSNCTYVNFSSILYPNGTQAVGQVTTNKTGTKYNYTFCRTSELGVYTVTGYGDLDGVVETFEYYFEVTPDGFSGTLGFYALILVFSAGVIILGLTKRDAPITIIGSFGLYFVGLFVLFFGIDGMKDTVYTQSFAIMILFLAAYISIRSAYELITNAD